MTGKLLLKKSLNILGVVGMLLLSFCAYSQELASVQKTVFPQPDQQESKEMEPLEKALLGLEEHFKVHLNFELSMIKEKYVRTDKKASDFKNVEEALQQLLNPVKLKYEKLEANYYVIYQPKSSTFNRQNKKEGKLIGNEEELFPNIKRIAILPAGFKRPKDVAVKGTVISSEDEKPIPGVNVMVKGTANGTITDINGNYTLAVPDSAVLVFSFVGFITEEVPVNGRSVIDMVMVSDIKSLSEVVVVGYGEQKRANVLGAVETISTEEVEDIPASNLGALLQGRLAGVSTGQSSGRPGASSNFSIRTNPTFGAPTDVLFVIDGFIRDQAAFEILDPTEVESISVLKDAAAAVYGARGAGGVVLVTTKKGREGKPRINYSGSIGMAEPRQMVEMLSAYDHATLLNDVTRYKFPNTYTDRNEWYTEEELEYFKRVEHNWMDEAFKNAVTSRHTLNVSGGSDRVRYFGSGSYYNETGSLPGTQYQKYTLRLGMDADITKDLSASLKISSDNNLDLRPFNAEDGGNYNAMNGTFEALLQTPRWIPSYINGLPVGQYGTIYQHPLEVNNINSYARQEGSNTVINSALEYKVPFVEGLRVRAAYSQARRSGAGKSYRVNYQLYNFKTAGAHNHIITNELDEENPVTTIDNDDKLSFDHSSLKNYQFNSSIAYDQTFGRHDLSALVVYEQAESSDYYFSTEREGILVEGFEQFGGFSGDQLGNQSREGHSGRLSYIGRLNYGYAGKYLFEGTFRYEGSQKFAPENRWGFFPALAVGWRISEEPFFKNNVSFMDNLKLRVSGGLLGNDNIGPRQWERSFSTRDGAYLGGIRKANAIQNRNEGLALTGVTWEKTASYNGGIDMRFVNNVSLQFDYYYRYTWDILANRGSTLPTSAGINKPPNENYGRMSSNGFDASVNYEGSISNNFGFDVGVNMHWGRSIVLEVHQNPEAYGAWDDQIGKMPNGETGLIALGIIRTQAQLDRILEENPDYTIFDRVPELGMIYYKDVGGPNRSDIPDGKITKDDRRIIAPAVNALGFGINLGASWKGFRVSTNFGLNGFGTYEFYDKESYRMPSANLNGPAFWKDHWTPENPDAAYPSPVFASNEERSTFWMRDGLDFSLNMVNASYKLPKVLSEKWRIPEMRIYFSGRNMWRIINPLEYKDPSLSRFNSYPMMRTYNLGLNITI